MEQNRKNWFSLTDNVLAERVRSFQGHKRSLESSESLKIVKAECKGIYTSNDAPFPSESKCRHDNASVGSI